MKASQGTRWTVRNMMQFGLVWLVLPWLCGCAQSPQEGTSKAEPPDRLLLTGLDDEGRYADANPLEVDEALVQRGQEVYTAFCVSCHGASGDGRGPMFRSTKMQAGDFRAESFQHQSEGQVFVTISRGMGMMVGFESQLSPQDRWAVVAYVRTLGAP